jgi:hypothetical protein
MAAIAPMHIEHRRVKCSYVIVTHNRRQSLLRTLSILHRRQSLPPGSWEVWVVDNASSDGTAECVRQAFPNVKILRRPGNEGVGARSYAFDQARGEYLILLDDDSYPIDDAARRSIAYLDIHPECAAVVGRVVLPDASLEACAFPTVMVSGAVCLRKSVLEKIGGFRREFFHQAGEYDLSFRIWQAGYSIERFEDVLYRHDRVPGGRDKALAHRMDLRNNLILVERYLPRRVRRKYRRDSVIRHAALGRHDGCATAVVRARIEAMLWRWREAIGGRSTLWPQTLERIFGHQQQANTIDRWAKAYDIRKVVIADFPKTLFATYDACRRAKLDIAAVADNHPAYARMTYRRVPILGDRAAFALQPIDGVVIANINPAQIDAAAERMRRYFDGPILRLWQPRVLGAPLLAAAA